MSSLNLSVTPWDHCFPFIMYTAKSQLQGNTTCYLRAQQFYTTVLPEQGYNRDFFLQDERNWMRVSEQ